MRFEIDVDGLEKSLNVLTTFAPELRKKVGRRLRNIGTTVAGAAARKMGSRTGSRGIYSQTTEAASGYRVRTRTSATDAVSVTVANTTKPGAIIEFAGSANPGGKTKSGAALIRTLTETYGPPGRVLWDSWDVLEPWARDEVADIVEEAEREASALLG